MLPNMFGVLANSPAVVNAYAAMQGALADSGLTQAEQQVSILAIAAENGCTYCVPAHTMAAAKAGLDDAHIEALRDGRDLDDPKLNALKEFALTVVRKRGRVDDTEIDAFLKAGFRDTDILDVILTAAMKTITNYTNHIAHVPLDEAFEPKRWEDPAEAAE